jgi:integrase
MTCATCAVCNSCNLCNSKSPRASSFDSGSVKYISKGNVQVLIAVDPEMLEDLRDSMSRTKGPFIVQSNRTPGNDSARAYYRCQPIFERLNEWLRSKGVTANKPLHELRKEIGALIATKHGIYAASRFLRHSDITTTARHYAEHKSRISVGLGKLLELPTELPG